MAKVQCATVTLLRPFEQLLLIASTFLLSFALSLATGAPQLTQAHKAITASPHYHTETNSRGVFEE